MTSSTKFRFSRFMTEQPIMNGAQWVEKLRAQGAETDIRLSGWRGRADLRCTV